MPTRRSAGDPTPATTEPLWLSIARRELGQKEIPGGQDNPRIVEYHKTTTLKATDDETPWCSAFVNWAMTLAGFKGTSSAAARDLIHLWVDEKRAAGESPVPARESLLATVEVD